MTDPAFEPPAHVVVGSVTERYKRRPDHAEGASGVVERVHGPYIPAGAEEAEFLYSVRFDPGELWENAESNQAVYIDLWERALSLVKDGHIPEIDRRTEAQIDHGVKQ